MEKGCVAWTYELDEALLESKRTSRPVFLLFQEIPGCSTCSNFGRHVLTNPIIVDAVETLFVPCLVNNRGERKQDQDALDRFQEPKLNNPVVRFLDANAQDLIPRKDGIYTAAEMVSRIELALVKMHGAQGCPEWLSEIRRELDFERLVRTRKDRIEKVAFYMGCYWTGEAELGRLALPECGSCPIISTRCEWYGVYEAVDVVFDSEKMPLAVLLQQVKEHIDVTRVHGVIPINEAQKKVAEDVLGSNRVVTDSSTGRELRYNHHVTSRDQKYFLQYKIRDKLDIMTERQKMLGNALIANSDTDAWMRFLSPRQIKLIHS